VCIGIISRARPARLVAPSDAITVRINHRVGSGIAGEEKAFLPNHYQTWERGDINLCAPLHSIIDMGCLRTKKECPPPVICCIRDKAWHKENC